MESNPGEALAELSSRKPRTRTLLLLAFVLTVITNCWWRGPVFGAAFLCFTLPPTLLVAALLRYARAPQWGRLLTVAVVAVLISYVLCAPPSTSRLFTRYLGTSIPQNVRDLRRWDDNWGRDPAYFVRFYASEETIEHIAKCARMAEVAPRAPTVPVAHLRSVPDWWRPGEIASPRFWQNRVDAEWFSAELRWDPQSGLAYIEVWTL